MKVFMMQFINTFRGFRTSCACKLIETLFLLPQRKMEKSGLTSETMHMHIYVAWSPHLMLCINDIRQCRIELQDLCIATLINTRV